MLAFNCILLFQMPFHDGQIIDNMVTGLRPGVWHLWCFSSTPKIHLDVLLITPRGSVLLLHFAVGLPVKNFPQGFVQLLTTNQSVMYFCQIWNPTTITQKQLHNLCRKKGILLYFSNEFGLHVFFATDALHQKTKEILLSIQLENKLISVGKISKKSM